MIVFYTIKGNYVKEEELTRSNIEKVHGLKIRCTLKNGKVLIGYCSSAEMMTGENIEISCDFDSVTGFKDKQVILCEEICKIEAMQYTNPRWGTKVDFSFDVDRNKVNKVETSKVIIPDFLKIRE